MPFFCMLPAYIVAYNVCRMYLLSFINKEKNAFDTIPFHEIKKKQIHPYCPWPQLSTVRVEKCFDC